MHQQVNQIGKQPQHPAIPVMEREEDKPERFLNKEHQISWEIDANKKMILKIELEDTTCKIVDFNENMTQDYILKKTYNVRDKT